jgi:hypothetical protein
MQCPSCKKEIPDSSTFCLHCGGRIVSTTSPAQAFDYEFTDYVWEIGAEWTCGKLITTTQKAQEYWQKYQSKILPDIREWVDKGWEPISEVGPAGFVIYEEPLGCLTMIFDSATYEAQRKIHIKEFRVKMRRKKT